jgi:hypothetical protein
MKKRSRTAQGNSVVLQPMIVKIGESAEIVDQDELQLKDELDKEWVQAWCKEIDKNHNNRQQK